MALNLRAGLQWVKRAAAWFTGKTRVKNATVKAAAEAVVAQSRADIEVLATRLQAGKIRVSEVEPLMQQAIKRGMIANAALAHGGYDNLTEAITQRIEAQVLAQHDYLHHRVQVIASNVRATGALSGRDKNDLLSYAHAFRSIYENEHLIAQVSIGHTQARRVLGLAQHCSSCAAVAARGWLDIESMPPLGSDLCGHNCRCAIETR